MDYFNISLFDIKQFKIDTTDNYIQNENNLDTFKPLKKNKLSLSVFTRKLQSKYFQYLNSC